MIIQALNGVDLTVESGTIFGILGPNGAGKTTLLNCLSLLVKPDEGEIHLFGSNAAHAAHSVSRRLNMSSGNANFPWCMTVTELLKFYGYLYGLYGRALDSRIEELMDLLNLTQYRTRRFDELSTGTKQRVALSKALINSPELLFLDEPTIGLDPDVAAKMRAFVQRINTEKKITILLTTHYMAEAEQLAQRIAFLQKGRIMVEGTPSELKVKMQSTTMEQLFMELSKNPLS